MSLLACAFPPVAATRSTCTATFSSTKHQQSRRSVAIPSTRRSRSLTVVASASTDAATDAWATTYPRWESIQQQLVEKYGLESISPQDAKAMVDNGQAVIVDARLKEDFDSAHPVGAISAPAFRIIKMGQGGFGSMVKAVLMQANGVTPTELNPEFLSQAKAAAANGKALIVTCEAGGTTVGNPNFPAGKASRSLKAAWRLLHYGAVEADKVYHLSTGMLGWYQADLPFEGEYDPSKAYRSPNSVTSSSSGSSSESTDTSN